MNEKNSITEPVGTWYSLNGKDNDVIVSTRVRLSRNLANFPFPTHFRDDDSERVQTLVFDAFSHLENPEVYQSVSVKSIDEGGLNILNERGVLDSPLPTGLVMGPKDNLFCMVNSQDHVRIESFIAGFDCNAAYNLCESLDSQLQKSLQFAAAYEYGYLNSSVLDSGSGAKISIRMHLPSLSYAGKIPEISANLKKKFIVLSDCYGSGSQYSPALGAFYQISTTSSCSGTETDQIVNLASIAKQILEAERKVRTDYVDTMPTTIRDFITRSYALLKFSRLIEIREAIEIVSNIKWGVNLGFLGGIGHNELSALLYRIQNGHLQYVLKTGSFKFEKDVENDMSLKIKRLRSLILQASFENLNFIA